MDPDDPRSLVPALDGRTQRRQKLSQPPSRDDGNFRQRHVSRASPGHDRWIRVLHAGHCPDIWIRRRVRASHQDPAQQSRHRGRPSIEDWDEIALGRCAPRFGRFQHAEHLFYRTPQSDDPSWRGLPQSPHAESCASTRIPRRSSIAVEVLLQFYPNAYVPEGWNAEANPGDAGRTALATIVVSRNLLDFVCLVSLAVIPETNSRR